MASKNTKTKNSKGIAGYITGIEEIMVYIYLFCMLGIFPLYYENGYSKIGNLKYEFFWNISITFVIASVVFIIAKVITEVTGNKDKLKLTLSEIKGKFSMLDYAVLAYGICVIISYLLSPYKDYAFEGSPGWEMGLCSQLMFIFLYFLISRKSQYGPFILGVHMTTSFLTYIFGILHRFDIDPLGMYPGLSLEQKVEFLSTIGQATWFSSYVCTGFAIGVVVFFLGEVKWVRVIGGIYTVASFGILVTQNSDSAFLAIAGILLFFGFYCTKDLKSWCRFWEIVSIMWGTFAGIGLLQRVFADRAIPLDTLSMIFSQGVYTWAFLIVSLGILFFYRRKEKQGKTEIMKITGKLYKVFLVLVAVAILGMIIFIYLNTKTYLYQWFGYYNSNKYLSFTEKWGSSRGVIWMSVVEGLSQLPLLHKLFGVGPDSLAPYLYSIPEISETLQGVWGEVTLTNAHNEYLNSLLCYGIAGLISWIAVTLGGIGYFYKKAKENPIMIGFALCIVGYACHNISCYQQVCCTPILFIALGIGENLTKTGKFNTIK